MKKITLSLFLILFSVSVINAKNNDIYFDLYNSYNYSKQTSSSYTFVTRSNLRYTNKVTENIDLGVNTNYTNTKQGNSNSQDNYYIYPYVHLNESGEDWAFSSSITQNSIGSLTSDNISLTRRSISNSLTLFQQRSHFPRINIGYVDYLDFNGADKSVYNSKSNQKTVSLSYGYKMFRISYNYNESERNNLITNEIYGNKNNSGSLNINFSIKPLSRLSISGYYDYSASKSQNNITTTSLTDRQYIRSAVNFKPLEKLSLNYGVLYSINRNKLSKSTSRPLSHSFSLNAKPFKLVTFSGGGSISDNDISSLSGNKSKSVSMGLQLKPYPFLNLSTNYSNAQDKQKSTNIMNYDKSSVSAAMALRIFRKMYLNSNFGISENKGTLNKSASRNKSLSNSFVYRFHPDLDFSLSNSFSKSSGEELSSNYQFSIDNYRRGRNVRLKWDSAYYDNPSSDQFTNSIGLDWRFRGVLVVNTAYSYVLTKDYQGTHNSSSIPFSSNLNFTYLKKFYTNISYDNSDIIHRTDQKIGISMSSVRRSEGQLNVGYTLTIPADKNSKLAHNLNAQIRWYF